MKTHNNLFDEIIDKAKFYDAFANASKGKRDKYEYLRFAEWQYYNMSKLRESILMAIYKPQEPTQFTIFEPKPRNISAPKFTDRIVQHAIYSVIYPIFNKTFLPNSYACRKGYGTHKAAKDVQAAARKHSKWWYLKTDFSKYFKSILRSLVWWAIDKTISCKRTIHLLETVFPRDGVGLPIGALLSQLFANVVGNIVDMFIKHALRIKTFFRYMDDIVIFGKSRLILLNIKNYLSDFINKIGLKFSKWFIRPITSGINFVGYRIWATHKLIRKDSIARAKRKLKTLVGEEREKFLASWRGHLQHADTYNLQVKLGII